MTFKEFMTFLLQIDPKQRPSAQEVLNHKFFKIDSSTWKY